MLTPPESLADTQDPNEDQEEDSADEQVLAEEDESAPTVDDELAPAEDNDQAPTILALPSDEPDPVNRTPVLQVSSGTR